MMTVPGKISQSLPSIGVIAYRISQFTSSCTEKNMITHSTTASETIYGSDAHLLLQRHHKDVMTTAFGNINHPLPSIGMIAHTISQFTSSCMEKNTIAHSTTSSETIL
jgi:hypothetical protein